MPRLITLAELQSIPLQEHEPGDVDTDENNGGPPDAWGDPAPLGGGEEPPRFPIHALPPVLADFVTAQSVALSVPIDLVAMLAVGTVAGVVQRTCDVQIRPGYTEPCGLCIAIALPPASRKSAAFRVATRPATAWEKRRAAEMSEEIAEARARRKTLEKSRDRESDPDAAGKFAREVEAMEVPRPPRVVLDDTTPEKLAEMLASNPGLALMSPEGAALFDALDGRYRQSKGPSYGVVLKAHAGDRICVDRIGRDSLRTDDPRLTIVTTTQPDALRQLGAIAGAKGLGLLGRFLYLLPRSTVGQRPARPPAAPTRIVDAYDKLITGLLDRLTPHESGDRRALAFSPEADDTLAAFHEEIEPRLSAAGDLDTIADWAGKLPGAVARIAGSLHVVTHALEPAPWLTQVSAATVGNAVELGRYLLAHALLAFDLMGADPQVEAARAVWTKIAAKGWQRFTVRELHAAMRGRQGFGKRSALDEPLRLLTEHGYIRPESAGPRGAGRPSEVYRRNPRA